MDERPGTFTQRANVPSIGVRENAAPPSDDVLGPVDVVLADGSTAVLRYAVPDDREALIELHARLSPESATLRYFGFHPRLTEADLARISDPHPDHRSLLAERDGELVAVAEYHRPTGSDEAEVAFVVADTFQGRGLGTLLLEHLASEARRHGVRRFVADTMAENGRMQKVFRDAGFASTTSIEAGVVHVVLDIAPSDAALQAADERDRQAAVRSMERLLRPGSIAVIGASRKPGSIGHALVSSLTGGGFTGPVYPVNPKARSVASLPCWPSVLDVPDEVDLAVIAVPAALVPGVVAECGKKHVGALVIVSSGFAETGADGESTERAIKRQAHELGMRLVGPNCFGVVNTEPGVLMNATFAPEHPLSGRVGFASQSGGLGIAILGEAAARGIGVSSFVSMGNKADVSGNDLLMWWENDAATDVALLYLESFGNPRKFARLAKRFAANKPIVAVKAGRSNAGTAAASSHTAALASSDQAVDALFRQSGVIRVDTVEELFDVSEVLANQPLACGDRVAIVTNAGGPGVLAADACSRFGLEVPVLSSAVQARIAAVHAPAASVRNPVDLAAGATPEAFSESLDLVLSSGEVDAVVVIYTPPLLGLTAAIAEGVVAGVRAAADRGVEMPVVATFFGAEGARTILRGAPRPIPSFTYPETAVRALSHAVAYGRWRRAPIDPPRYVSGTDANEARRRLESRSADGWLTGSAAMAVLQAYGIPTLTTVHATDARQAAKAARGLGFPAALKADGPQIIHKTEIGGVRLGLDSEVAVEKAFDELRSSIGPVMTGAVVQPMAAPGVELIVGFTQDAQFGPVVLVGLGGTAVEILGDHSVALAPLSESEARSMIDRARAGRILTGYRGSPPADVTAVTDVLIRLSRLAEDIPEILEADCNPLIAGPSGALVADARLRVSADRVELPDDRRHLR